MASNGRGILLLLVAFVIGVAVLRSTDPGSGTPTVAPTGAKTTTTSARRTTTTVPPVTTVPARPPAEVKVLPVNGSGTAGLGGKTGDKLRSAGYENTLAAVNATSDTPAATSTVEYAPGAQADAQAVAVVLGLPPTAVKPLESPPVSDTRGAEVVVLIGRDLAGSASGSATTSTTR